MQPKSQSDRDEEARLGSRPQRLSAILPCNECLLVVDVRQRVDDRGRVRWTLECFCGHVWECDAFPCGVAG